MSVRIISKSQKRFLQKHNITMMLTLLLFKCTYNVKYKRQLMITVYSSWYLNRRKMLANLNVGQCLDTFFQNSSFLQKVYFYLEEATCYMAYYYYRWVRKFKNILLLYYINDNAFRQFSRNHSFWIGVII